MACAGSGGMGGIMVDADLARDGRVVPASTSQALSNEPLTVFGDGSQTRSFCYVSDLIDGIFRLALSK